MPEIKKLVIPREKWGAGALVRSDGKMCCLGHLGKACGVPVAEMLSMGMPSGLDYDRRFLFPKKFRDKFMADDLAAKINDDTHMSGPEKERQLKILFSSRDIKLTFTGKGEP
jgi:hypothetical protein